MAFELGPGRRGCAGDSARPATHGCANRSAGRAPDRKRHQTPYRRTDSGAGRTARHGARTGIGVPTPIPLVISAVIGRIGDPPNMLITAVGIVPIGIVIGDRRSFPISVQVMHPPAFAVRIAGYITSFDRLGAGIYGRYCARDREQGTQSKRNVKLSHVEPFMAASRIRQFFNDVRNEAVRRWFRPRICQQARNSGGKPTSPRLSKCP